LLIPEVIKYKLPMTNKGWCVSIPGPEGSGPWTSVLF